MKPLLATTLILAASAIATAQDQQVGARTKAMGGSYTAFEDDPVSVWLNPAGIATQSDGGSIAFQSYTLYGFKTESAEVAPTHEAKIGWSDPPIVPSFLGATFQLGSPEQPQSLGICFVTPFHLRLAYDDGGDPSVADIVIDQSFYRIRLAYSRAFRFRAVGSEGFFSHISLGVGADLNVTSWSWTRLFAVAGNATTLSDQDIGFGGGVGLLIGLYDNTRNFKVNFGAAYQSKANYDFGVVVSLIPLFDWPNQFQMGLTLYLLEGIPLRLTFDAQLIEWDRASPDSTNDGSDSFGDVTNFSFGAEYRWKLSEAITLYLRGGLRLFNAPWRDASNLPSAGEARLRIRTDDDQFVIGSVGFGIGWSTESEKTRIVDLAFDYGGDAPGLALGYSMEF